MPRLDTHPGSCRDGRHEQHEVKAREQEQGQRTKQSKLWSKRELQTEKRSNGPDNREK